MSFFKAFKNSYAPVSQDDGAPLPAPATAALPNAFKTRLARLNPFRDRLVYLEDDDNYVTSEPGYFELSRWDRMLIFALTFGGLCCCYLICIFLFPVLLLKPRKFALLWLLGLILFLVSFGVLQGAQAYAVHLLLSTRIVFTVVFATSIVLTLVLSLVLRSTLLLIVFAAVQLLSAVWYTVSYFPLGTQTLNLAGLVARTQVEGWIAA